MGATNFETIAFGDTVRDAFNAAVEQAHWEYGHRGYTGTIAEKSLGGSAILPAGLTAVQTLRLIEAYWPEHEDWQKFEDPKAMVPEKWHPDTPEAAKPAIRRLWEAWGEKWGPALALPLTPDEVAQFRDRHGVAGKGKNGWLFCGMASC